MTNRSTDTDTSGTNDRTAFQMKIGGVSCSFCASTIDKAYGRIDGVYEVGVSLAPEQGLVKYDLSRVTPDELRRTLEEMGYTYRDPEKVRTFDDDAAELRRERFRLTITGVFTGVSLLIMLFGMWLDVVDTPLMPWLLLPLALNTMFVTGWFVMKMAWASLRRGILNQHVLLEFAAFLSQIARSIDEARSLRPGVLHVVDAVLRYLARTVLVFAAAGFLIWTTVPMVLGGGPD